MGGAKKHHPLPPPYPLPPPPPTISFSPVTSTNIGISPKHFLTLSFNLFPTVMKNFKAIPSVSPKYFHPSRPYKTIPQKRWFFGSNPYKIVAMITSLIEMPELPNFGRMTTCSI